MIDRKIRSLVRKNQLKQISQDYSISFEQSRDRRKEIRGDEIGGKDEKKRRLEKGRGVKKSMTD